MATKLTSKQMRALSIATIVAVIVAFLIISEFLAAVLASCIAAYILVPVHKWFKKHKYTKKAALPLMWLVGLFGFIIPFTIITLLMIDQITNVVATITETIDSGELVITNESILEETNEFLSQISNDKISVTLVQIQDWALNILKAVGTFLVNILEGSVSNFPRFVTNLIVFFYVTSALVIGHKKLIALLKRVNPLGDEIMHQYLKKADGMTQAMIKGQFVVALAQGITGAIFLQFVGVGLFPFFAVILSFLSIIPLGGGIVTIPMGVILILTGNVFGGLFILASHFLIITNIDNVLRPKLVPKDIALSPALTMVSVLAGVGIFGFWGIVIGPVLFILALTTIETYADIVSPVNKSEKGSA